MTTYRKRLVEQVIAPSAEPVSISEVKDFLRIEHDEEDVLLATFIGAARRSAEEYMRRSLMEQQWKVAFDGYPPHAVRLPYGPASAVESVTIFQVDETSSVVDASHYFLSADKRMVCFEVTPCGHRVEIVYRAGASSASAVDPAIRQGLIAHVAALYEHREAAVMPEVVKAIYAPFREVRL